MQCILKDADPVSVTMAREVRFDQIEEVLDEIEYPAAQGAATNAFSDVTVQFADGEANLGELIAETATDRFDSADDLATELHNVLPRGAVGEPYQSEGEG